MTTVWSASFCERSNHIEAFEGLKVSSAFSTRTSTRSVRKRSTVLQSKEPTAVTLHIYSNKNVCVKVTTFPAAKLSNSFQTFEEENSAATSFQEIDSKMIRAENPKTMARSVKNKINDCRSELWCPPLIEKALSRYYNHSVSR